MRILSLLLWGVLGAGLGAVVEFLLLNLIGLAAYAVKPSADEGIDTALFYWSVIALPYSAVAGALTGVWVASLRRRKSTRPPA